MPVLQLIMKWFTVLITGSRIRLAMWIGSRLALGTGLAVVWRRLKGAPNRVRRFFVWFLALNAVSVLAFFGLARFVLR